MDHFKMFIGGEFVDAKGGRTMQCLDPGTGQPIATVPWGQAADADAAVNAARQAFDSGVWSNLPVHDRCEIITHTFDRSRELFRIDDAVDAAFKGKNLESVE